MIYHNLADSIWDVGNIEKGTIIKDFVIMPEKLGCVGLEDYVRGIVQKGPMALCAYAGVLKGHKYFEKDYDSIEDELEDAHGGLTYAGMGDDIFRPGLNMWYLGWDYAHAGDYTFYPEGFSMLYRIPEAKLELTDKKWTIKEVHDQCLSVCQQLVKMYKHQKTTRFIRMEE